MNDFDDMSFEELEKEFKRLKAILRSRKKEKKKSPFSRNFRYLRMYRNITLKELEKMEREYLAVNQSCEYINKSAIQAYESATGPDVPQKYKTMLCGLLNVDPELMEKDWFEIAKGENE